MSPRSNLCAANSVARTDLLPLAAAPMTAINKSLRLPKKINHRRIEMMVF
tara:strand:+ start:1396 stop:1545 length:150 start_codon:yes stop_codon:yes gene_type:complete